MGYGDIYKTVERKIPPFLCLWMSKIKYIIFAMSPCSQSVNKQGDFMDKTGAGRGSGYDNGVELRLRI